MNQLLVDAIGFLNDGHFDYAICGGFALDLFTGKNIRKHSDIDICVFAKDKNVIFSFIKENAWTVYEFCGGGIVRLVNSTDDCQSGRNLMCLKDGCELVEFYPYDRGENYFSHKFLETGIKSFNYLEFLFNVAVDEGFVFDRNPSICREMSKAILKKDGIPYLSPELVLLYKSEDIDRHGYQLDYDEAIQKMNDEQIDWFNYSLDILYPDGHVWRV